MVAASDGSDGSANDPCCLAMSSWDDMIAAAHSCGTWTIVEAAVLLVLVGVHIHFMGTNPGNYGWQIIEKTGTGAFAGVAAFGFAIPVLIDLLELWRNFTDLSDGCGGNEDWEQVEQAIWPLTVVHSVILIAVVLVGLVVACGMLMGGQSS